MNILLPKTVYAITGSDVDTFLQGQLSNDLSKISTNEVQLNCYMQHQGKILALLWVVRYEEVFHLIIENELTEHIIQRLTMFKLSSDVTITKTILQVVGRSGSEGRYSINNEQSIDILNLKEDLETDTNAWELLSIRNYLPEIYTTTAQTFIPQILNLDEAEKGVNFSKGCYVGQEVVARMHYLGKAKRRMYAFSAQFPVAVGDKLSVSGSDSMRASGVVVRVAFDESVSLFLATLEVKFINSIISIDNKTISLLHDA